MNYSKTANFRMPRRLRFACSGSLALLLLSWAAGEFHAGAASCFQPPSGLIGWWPGDGNALNIAGTNNGTLMGGAIATAPGEVATAFNFDGTNGFVQVADSAALRPTTLTIETWVRFDALDSLSVGGSPAGDQYLVFRQNTQNGNFEGFDLSKTRLGGGDGFRFLISSATGASVEIDSATRVTTNVWYHIAAVRDTSTMQLYVNGQLESSAAITFPQDYGNFPLYFGSSGEAYWDHKLRGSLDEVSLYNRALSASEIAAIYSAGTSGKCKAPSLITQPQGQSVLAGGTVTFSVTAAGMTPLSYQWQFNGVNLGGATSTNLVVANAQPTNAGNYTVVVSNLLGTVTSATASLTVLVPPGITVPPASATVVAGATASFSVNASGTATLSYQWQFNGANMAGATSANLSVVNAQPANAGNYAVVVTNSYGSVTSALAVLTVLVPPAISAQPTSQTNVAGSATFFSTTASGTAPLNYQWRLNGVNLSNGARISGATSNTLAITSLQASDAGNYTLFVGNSAGSVTSAPATLTVLVPPSIAVPPASLTAIAGTNVNFSVTASGTAPLSYQWQLNGTNLAGATATSLPLNNVQPLNAGGYAVVVTNSLGSVTSSVALLTVLVPPDFGSQPQSRTNVAGTVATFSGPATGTAPLSYQWKLNGGNVANDARISGASSDTLTISTVQVGDAGNYTLTVSNSAGTITSSPAALTVLTPPSITAPPANVTAVAGTNVNFSVTATGTAPLNYQWLFNGANLGAAVTASLVLTNIQPIQAGNYSVVVTNPYGSITSAMAVLTVLVPPAITAQPQSRTNLAGTALSFSVAATGTAPLGYQWLQNGTNLVNGPRVTGATSNVLAISSMQASDAGNYTVVISNAAGIVTSAAATLTLAVAPGIIAQPAGETVMAGTTLSFNVAASGTAPLGYQWLLGGTGIAGGTSASLTISNAQPVNAGNYSVIVSNLAGAATSSVAVLAVLLPSSCFQPPSGLIGWWPGDGNAFTLAGTNNGTLAGGATANTPGEVGTAFSFDGTNSYVQVPDSTALRPTNLTIETWVRFTSLDSAGSGGSPAGDQYLVFRENTQSASFEGFDLSKTRIAGGDAFRFLISSATGVSIELDSVTRISTNVWYHLAAVRGPSTMQLFVNGQLERSTNITFVQDYGNFPLYFGSSGQSYWDHKLRGQLDEVSFYNRPLSSNEIGALYAAGTSGKCKAPSLTAQPQNQTLVAGGSATFSVAATGMAPLSYQWQFNGVNLTGATSTNLVVANAQPANAGNYSVVVSNALGLVDSATAVLTVLVPPAITVQPQSRTNIAGTSPNFTVTATGTAPVSYQWLFNGASLANGGRISGAGTASLGISGVQPADAGNYSVTISNIAGMITSTVAGLTVLVPPAITAQPASQSALAGTNVVLTVAATGTAPLSYQWQFNGANLAGATGTTLSLSNIQPPNGGNYTVVITNSAGSTTSAVAVLTVLVAPTITAQPQSRTNVTGTTVTLNATAFGAAPLAYQWQLNGIDLANDARISGATTAILSVANVQPGDAGGYTLLVSNPGGSVTSAVATLVVWIPPAVATPPASQSAVVGSNATFNVAATGTAPLSYQWQFNGTNLAGNTGPSYTLINVQTAYAGNYAVVITNVAGVTTSSVAVLTVLLPSAITMQPHSRTNVTGTTALFAITATGTAPLSYQWHLWGDDLTNDGRISGATTPNLVIADVQDSDFGRYSVTVSNIAGQVESAAAGLTVWMPPSIEIPPSSLAAVQGSNATLNVTATGTAPLSYQWQFNGSNLDGATDSVFTLTNVQPLNGGNYAVVITNVAGSTTSALTALTVLMPPTLTSQPASTTNVTGTTANFGGSASGTSPLGYQWQFNGVNLANNERISGATSANLAITGVQAIDAGAYNLVVSNIAGVAVSSGANLTVWVPPAITTAPASQSIVLHSNATLTVSATGTAPLSYQWMFDGAIYDGETGSSLTLTSVETVDAGNYSVIVTNVGGSITSQVAVITVLVPPLLWGQPQSRTNVTGTSAAFSVGVTGTAPLSYQWLFNGANIAAATNSSFSVNSVQVSDGGDYSVVVTNVAGAATSSVAGLTVWVPPAMQTQPANSINPTGAVATFTATVTGTTPLAYAWQFGGVPLTNGGRISGADTLTLSLSNLQLGDAGNYTLVATNAAGAITSAIANLNVTIPVSIPDPNLDRAVRAALSKPSGTLISLDIQSLGSLTAEGAGITNLAGLEWGTGLGSLFLGGNLITNLGPLHGLGQLRSLSIYGNQLADISPLGGLTNLNYLELRWIPATNVSSVVASLRSLTNLFLGGCSISDAAFLTNLSQMTFVGLDHNQIADPSPLAGLPNLSGLDLSFNPLTSASAVGAFTNLTRLGLSGDSVTSLGFVAGMSGLTALSVYSNAITDPTPLNALSGLQELNLSGNPVNWYGSLANLTNLGSLLLQGNAVGSLSFLPGLNQLSFLGCDQCKLADTSALSALTNLHGLSLSGNNLGSSAGLGNLGSLNYLDFSYNSLTNFVVLGGLTNLSRLYLAGNNLTNLNFTTGLTRLSALGLDHNLIRDLGLVGGLTNLNYVNASYNRVTNIAALQGLPAGLFAQVQYDLLDVSPNSATMAVITSVQNAGGTVAYLPQNQPPSIAVAANWLIDANATSQLAFSVSDDVVTGDQLQVTASSANQTLLPSSGIILGGSVNSRTLAVTPAANQTGNVVVSLAVTDDVGLTSTGIVLVTVTASPSAGIVDPNLDAALRALLGKSTGTLTRLDLQALTSFIYTGPTLTNLTGLEWATNLSVVSLNASGLSSLSVLANFTQLTALALANVAVSDLSPIAGLTNLTSLNLSGTAINNLASVQNLKRLSALTLLNTSVASLAPLAGLTNLSDLFLEQNLLTNISSLTNLSKLNYVDLRYNLLDGSPSSAATTAITILQNRGVTVYYYPQRTPPTISIATNWVVAANQTSSIYFFVSDVLTPSSSLIVSATSSNPALLQNTNISTALFTSSRFVMTIAPVSGQTGVTTLTLTARNQAGLATSVPIALTVAAPVPISNSGLNWLGISLRSSANAPWFLESNVAHNGLPALQSGPAGDGQDSWVETTVAGPGVLNFWWKVSSEQSYDFLEFYINGVRQTNRLSGEVDWQAQNFNLGAGSQTLRWRYTKDPDNFSGADAGWLSEVAFGNPIFLEWVGGPTNGTVQLLLHSATGLRFQFLTSTNMSSWNLVANVTNLTGTVPCTDTNAGNTVMRFYRAKQLP